eukprot:CAMPEP_0202892248 /NCGR_PEP_ID=MMETSP1392-20130828/2009_1 /ASSEMBLY_ACC=CAM_ASM_000868 /TAXON_ID=225041 /ORGANISM="Chlamydomonas chlamydogama, Strain SAG 11-48b" /LENGTH=172 /DNA_ID=CAMNT_0049576141 /DNA_START=113 /DNA_END=635 /DNA_ORIENTATION=+
MGAFLGRQQDALIAQLERQRDVAIGRENGARFAENLARTFENAARTAESQARIEESNARTDESAANDRAEAATRRAQEATQAAETAIRRAQDAEEELGHSGENCLWVPEALPGGPLPDRATTSTMESAPPGGPLPDRAKTSTMESALVDCLILTGVADKTTSPTARYNLRKE